ncbi:MAG: MBL fold metallo-hydrolase [Clostridia bacterium]|nr:MBL fold metallo-hydrolase [Clostridia bacterium]
MKAHVLFSGSKGNCTYMTDGDTSILVDAGGNLKRIRECLEALGDGMENIKGIFVTHEHTDHVKALYNIVKKYDVRIFTTVETARAVCSPCKNYDVEDCRRVASSILTVKPDKTYEIGTMSVKPFSTPHDVAGSLGFLIESTKDKKSIGYATDIGHVTEDMRRLFSGVRNIVIESNHDIEMLKSGPYPEFLKERILSERGHLSNTACAEFVRELEEKGSKSFTLAHLSEENNRPDIALKVSKDALRDRGDVVVKTASAYSMTEIEIL